MTASSLPSSSLPNSKLPIALITGASRGLGAQIALTLAKRGMYVALNYSSSVGKAEALLRDIEAKGGQGELLQFDVSDSLAVDKQIEDLIARKGAIHTLVNNAGIAIDGLLMRLKDEDLEKTLAVDLKGAIYCTRAASRTMMKAREGVIINISSVIGESGNAGQSAYAAAKAGLIGFTKSVARELATRNIRCNAITPGFIETDMTAALTETQKNAILQTIPIGCLGKPEDVAELVAFLASDASRYITGQVIGVNGGMYM